MQGDRKRVVVLGASSNPERYSNMAVKRLLENHHEVIPVHPALDRVEGLDVASSLGEIDGRVDTLTIYVSPAVSSKMTDAIIALRPGRVIFNPGAENPNLETALEEHGVPTQHACTLVLLSTGQF